MKPFLCLILFAVLLDTGTAAAQAPVPVTHNLPPELPVAVPEEGWHSLYEQVDPVLEQRLRRRLDQNRQWAALIRDRRMAVGIVDMRNPAAPRFARVNGDEMMYAASLPKLAILLAAMQALEDGTLVEGPAVRQDLNDMIRVSSNSAATRMIDRVGGLEQIQAVLTDPRYAFYDPSHGGGLWVGKAYAKSGPRIGDPLEGLSHAATVSQVSRFYYLLATGRLVSRNRSRQMLEYLVDPGINHKFVNALSLMAPRARVFRKSGTWRNWHSDSALVWGPVWRRYIVVCLVEDANGERILRDLIPAVEQVLR
jgi:beta-lactamase class A